jgi:iron complex outermembrane receptor protein
LRFRLQSCYYTGFLVFFSLISWFSAFAQSAPPSGDFASKSIEELMSIDITSVSRKEQKLSKTPAAVYVITREAIARSGVNTIPDLLRMVPGVQVAQVDANRWAISVRGFNDLYSNKLLVLVDGRTVYTPSFSGVYWNQIDVPLDTIERIEVVRGPGGTVWGANAVNGVINIITEHSQDTQGGRLSAGAGSFQTGGYEARWGGHFARSGTYRAFGDFESFNSLLTAQGQNGHDGWQRGHGGFRADFSRSAKDAFVFEGNVFQTNGGQEVGTGGNAALRSFTQPANDHGFDLLGRWTRAHSDNSQSSLQIYGSNYTRLDTSLEEKVSTLDLDFQNHTSIGSRNDIVWGAGYRFNSDKLENTYSSIRSLQDLGFYSHFLPPRKDYSLFSVFFQDEISIASKLALTAGTKVEHNAFTGFEYEPSVRLAWTPNDPHTFWMAASQAVRQPSRLDTANEIQISPTLYSMSGLAITGRVNGNPHFQAETTRTYEAGYRLIPTTRVSFDLSAFYSFYRNLKSGMIVDPQLIPQRGLFLLNIPIVAGNGSKARNYGAEASVGWHVSSRWKLNTGYSWLRTNVFSAQASISDPGLPLKGLLPTSLADLIGAVAVTTPINRAANGTTPEQQLTMQSYLDLSSKLSFDNSLYYVGRLEGKNIPAYTRVDTRLAYKLGKRVEVSLAWQNLLSPRHFEFAGAVEAIETQATRSIFGRAVWTF